MSQSDVAEGLQLLYNWSPTERPRLPVPQEAEEISFGELREKSISQYSRPHTRMYFTSAPTRAERVLRFAKDNFQSLPQAAQSEVDAVDSSFTVERLRRYASSANSPSCIQIKPTVQKTQEAVFYELFVMSIKSGLMKINVFELISKLKYLAFKGVYKLKLKEFLTLITSMSQYNSFPSHHMKVIKQYLTTIFKIFDPKSNSSTPR